ncbi:MAG: hypothetical protein IPK83_23415 [Planctomycetes bacterium]|nr:hypothetical protein [Planctomycetota bacterium]
MTDKPTKSIVDIARELDRYKVDAFEFLHEGLDYTVRRIHGPSNNAIENVVRWMRENSIDPEDIETLMESGSLPHPVVNIIEDLGGSAEFRQKINRHVGGPELCWGLRDLALEKWGIMAQAVLGSWGIFKTRDFGRMVFALVENDLLQKQPEDRVEDFDNVFEFNKAFCQGFKITLPGSDD